MKSIVINDTSLVDMVYPIGSIYMSTSSVSPAMIFGGGWRQLKDKFLLGAGDTYSAGTSGGEATHKLTIDEMPIHSHPIVYEGVEKWPIIDIGVADAEFGWHTNYTDGYRANAGRISSTGGDQPHNNMPPYLVIYMWERIS